MNDPHAFEIGQFEPDLELDELGEMQADGLELEDPGVAHEVFKPRPQPKAKPKPKPAPRPAKPNCTGEFRGALCRFARTGSVPDDVLLWLEKSRTFNAIVKTLDQKYFDPFPPNRLPKNWDALWAPDANGIFTQGPHTGRRMIELTRGLASGFCSPTGWSGTACVRDFIQLKAPPQTAGPGKAASLAEKGGWLERIAHESVHAWRHVLGSGPAGNTAGKRIQSAIDDEIVTRKLEGKIVKEAGRAVASFARYPPTTGSTEQWKVERDFFQEDWLNGLRATHLEYFVLAERLDAAAKSLTGTKRLALEVFVDRIDLGKRPLTTYLTQNPKFVHPDSGIPTTFQDDYSRSYFMRRVVDARWRAVNRSRVRDLHRDKGLEKVRQDHAKAFFSGLAKYTRP